MWTAPRWALAAFCVALSFGARLGEAAGWQAVPGYRYLEVQPDREGVGVKSAGASERPVGFAQMPAALTGISFSNGVPESMMVENQNYLLGSGVAAGDFDGDGRCDLYFCAMNGTNALYRNLGNWRFEDVTAKAGVGCPLWHCTGATFADLDGDGRLDLLVATLGNGVHCFMNEGNGHFHETTTAAGLAAQTGSTTLALGDVNGDGNLDLFVANYGALAITRGGGRALATRINDQIVFTGPYANRLRMVNGQLEEVGEPSVLYLNDGHGHFRAVPWDSEYFLDEEGKPKAAPWDFSLTVQMRDINGDGVPDLYVCNDFDTVDRIWLNDGHGHFRALPRLAMRKQSFSSMGVDFADVDRDGRFDFVVTEMMGRDHARRTRNVVGMRPNLPMPGRIDDRPETPRNTCFWNRGDGTYAEIANYAGIPATDWTWQPAFLDVDLDGYEDLLILTGHAYDVQDRDVIARIRALGKQTPEQSRANLLLYPPFLTPCVAFRNRGDLKFEDASAAWGFDFIGAAHGLAMADLDGDGDLDVVINRINAPPLLLRNRTTAPRLAVRLHGRAPNLHGIGALIRVLGGPVPAQMQEILCGGRYLSSDDTMRVFAAGGLTNELTIEVRWRSGRTSLVHGARANRVYEISEPEDTGPALPPLQPPPAASKPWFTDVSAQLGHVHQDPWYPDYLRQPLLMRQLSQLGPSIAWVDLDGDGHDELVIGAGKGGTISIYRGQGPFEKVELPAWATPDDTAGLVAWSGADGQPMALAALANYESGATNGPLIVGVTWDAAARQMQLGAASSVASWGASPGPLAAADMDGDGRLELFVGGRVIPGKYPQATASRLFRQQQGQLVPDAANNAVLEDVGLVSGAVWSDLDNDGFPELILACEWGPIKVFKNDHGRLREATAELGLAGLTGWWNGVTTGDFDGDGRMDIIAANWGLNTSYDASPERPVELYYGNLADRGVMDLVEAYYPEELQVAVPRRTLSALSQAFPWLTERFPTHAAFGSATMADFKDVWRNAPQVLRVTTLATTLFLNRGSNFLVVPLPAEAQFAPAFGLCVGDADGDGNEDLFLSQNFFATRPEWPRLDGGRGLWLRGDGHGRLAPVPGQVSGVRIYGEQRGAALADFNEDGRVDLVVTQDGAPTVLYRNTGGKLGLRVRLKGPSGNPWGIGALVRLQFGNRLGPAREFHAGSGYWSQDSLVQVLGCPEPPSQIHVLWPGGKRQVAAVPSGAREITVRFQP